MTCPMMHLMFTYPPNRQSPVKASPSATSFVGGNYVPGWLRENAHFAWEHINEQVLPKGFISRSIGRNYISKYEIFDMNQHLSM